MYSGRKGILVCVTLAMHLLPLIGMAQAGRDGVKVINGSTIVNEYTSLSANANSGSTSITVTSSSLNNGGLFSANLNPGDLIFIIQMQGA